MLLAKLHRTTVARWAYVLICVSLSGCGGSTERVFGYGDADADEIAGHIAALSDLADRPDRLKDMFAASSLPDEAKRQKFIEYAFATVEKPQVRGDTATAQVAVTDLSQKVLGVQQWTAVKVDGKWLLKDTPLP